MTSSEPLLWYANLVFRVSGNEIGPFKGKLILSPGNKSPPFKYTPRVEYKDPTARQYIAVNHPDSKLRSRKWHENVMVLLDDGTEITLPIFWKKQSGFPKTPYVHWHFLQGVKDGTFCRSYKEASLCHPDLFCVLPPVPASPVEQTAEHVCNRKRKSESESSTDTRPKLKARDVVSGLRAFKVDNSECANTIPRVISTVLESMSQYTGIFARCDGEEIRKGRERMEAGLTTIRQGIKEVAAGSAAIYAAVDDANARATDRGAARLLCGMKTNS